MGKDIDKQIQRDSISGYDGVGYAKVSEEYRQLHQERLESQKVSTKHINLGYFYALLLTICIGTIQFGMSISAWNSGWPHYKNLIINGTNPETGDIDYRQGLIQSLTTGGSAVGALVAGPVAHIGRWKCVIFCNIIAIIGGVCTLFYTQFYLLCIGKFLYGIACGGFSFYCPKYIGECSPKEISGPAGSMFQVTVCLGIVLNNFICVFLPTPTLDQSKFVFNLMNILPIGMAVLQITLLMCVYKFDTPIVMMQNGEVEKVRQFFSKLYDPSVIDERIQDIKVKGSNVSGLDIEDEVEATYGAMCCDPQYSKATFLGISLAVLQQLTGINVVLFYGSKLFGNIQSINVVQTNFLIGLVNFLGTLLGLFLLSKAGRKILMMIGSGLQAIILILLGLFLQKGGIFPIILLLLFVLFFEISSGPITWLYMAEIMHDKSLGIAVVMNWTVNLGIAIGTPYLIDAVGDENVGYIFIVLGAITFLGTLFIKCFMKETRNKTPQQIEEMFSADKGFSKAQGF